MLFLSIFVLLRHNSLFFEWMVYAMIKESQFQAALIKRLETIFPGCIVLKNDPTYIQGFPDLLILFNNKWAALECKRDISASKQPNQEYYVSKLNGMSYSNFIYPQNQEAVIDDLQRTFES